MDAGTLMDPTDQELMEGAKDLTNALAGGSWVAAALAAVAVGVALAKKFGLGKKKLPKPEEVKAKTDESKALDQLKMGDKDE